MAESIQAATEKGTLEGNLAELKNAREMLEQQKQALEAEVASIKDSLNRSEDARCAAEVGSPCPI